MDDAAKVAYLEKEARHIANILKAYMKDRFGGKVGFTLFLYDFGEGGTMTYLSTSQRGDMIRALKEFIEKHEKGEIDQVEGRN